MILPSPDGVELQEWADSVTFAISNYPNAWALTDGDWRQWGMQFFLDPYLCRYDPPDPHHFAHWREWAHKLTDTMSAAPGSPRR